MTHMGTLMIHVDSYLVKWTLKNGLTEICGVGIFQHDVNDYISRQYS